LKRTIAMGLVLSMLLCMVTVLAAGSATNPLITRSYLEGSFADSIRTDIESSLSAAATGSMNRLDDIRKSILGYDFAPSFTQITLAERDTVVLPEGASFMLTSGSAALHITGGTVINISTGTAAASGSQLVVNQRYFCTEETSASITASSESIGFVDGFYRIGRGGMLPPVTNLPFNDVFATNWFFGAVGFVFANNLFRGTSDTTFSPGETMTRAMFVTVLHRLAGLPDAGTSGGFTDVSDPALYYYDAVKWVSANNLISDSPDGTFRPNAPITREQMATVIYNYAAYRGMNMSSPGNAFDAFPDKDDVSAYAIHAMRWAVSREVIRGSDGRLLPRNSATRAEVAQIFVNFCNAFEQ
jgi:hypothetical protein